MALSLFDNAIYQSLIRDEAVARLFSASAEIRAMLLVEAALARAQAASGLIPETAAAAIERASREVQIDPAALSDATGRNAVPVPALVAEFHREIGAPEHAQYLHWGATSQDIIDTALMLRLRQVIALYQSRLGEVLSCLGKLANDHARLPMAARTYGQVATVTSFGQVAAAWGRPLLAQAQALDALKPGLLTVSLAGAAGTLSVMGDKGPAIRRAMADQLGLADPGAGWHTDRDALAGFSAWATRLTAALAKMGEDLILMSQTGMGEVTMGNAGASSTMPQKSNPVAASLLVTLARFVQAQNTAMQSAIIHRQQRDGAAWILEWMTLPLISAATGQALNVAEAVLDALRPESDAMMRQIDASHGAIFAEALSFALTEQMPRPEAQQAVKKLCREIGPDAPLAQLAARQWPALQLDHVFDPGQQLGAAADEATEFATSVKSYFETTS